jgi:hypothetical protein
MRGGRWWRLPACVAGQESSHFKLMAPGSALVVDGCSAVPRLPKPRRVRRQVIWDKLSASRREALGHLWLRLCGIQLMLQTTICDGQAFDPFAFEEDRLGPPEVDVSRSEIVEALVIAGMVVVLDEGRDLAFEIAG